MCNHFISNQVDPLLPLRHHLLMESIPSFSSSTIHHIKGILPVGSYADNFGKLGREHIRGFSRNVYQSKIVHVKQKEIESKLDIIERECEMNQSYFYIHRYYVQKIKEVESCVRRNR